MPAPLSFVPSFVSPALGASMLRCFERAEVRRLRVVGAGRVRAGEFAGCRCWAVSSSSRPGLCRLVVEVAGRLRCSCPAGQSQSVFCMHRALVRARIVVVKLAASALQPVRSMLPPAPGESLGAICPCCLMPAHWQEVEELGSCLACVYVPRADRQAPQPAPVAEPEPAPAVCPLCGEASEAAGLYCSVCRDARAKHIREQAAALQRSETAQRIMQREEDRQRALRRAPKGARRRIRAEQNAAQDAQIAAEHAA